MTEHRDLFSTRLRVARLHHAPGDWRGAKEWKELGRHDSKAQTFGFISTAQKNATRIKSGDLFKRLALLLPVDDVRHRHVALRDSLRRIDSFEENNAFWLRKLQR